METVRTRASESIVFGLKSTKKSTKVVKKRWRICSGTGDRGFESRRFDQKKKDFPCGSPSFFAPSRCTDLDTVALATWVRILRAERVELARKRQACEYSPSAKYPYFSNTRLIPSHIHQDTRRTPRDTFPFPSSRWPHHTPQNENATAHTEYR